MVFINRERELRFLRGAWEETRAQFIVIYGKRRVGKTELVKQFFKEVPHIYYLADKASESDQLRMLSERVGLMYKDEFLLSRGFGTWHEFFRYMKGRDKIIIAIDEFPFLIETNSAVPSIFQKGWDEELKDTNVSLILLGSSMGMMETEVLGHKSPLFGRRTGQMLIEPLSFREARKFFPRKTAGEFMEIYGVLGGTPAYLLQFDPSLDIWENIGRKILMPEAYLYSEPEFILREELREPRNYFSILRAVSLGKTRASEIINETGFEKNIVGKYLSVLTDLRIIRREVPVTEKSFEKSKKGIYILDDNFFRFWFSFVYLNKGFIQEGESEYVITNKLRPRMEHFISPVFEEVCRDFVRQGGVSGMRFNIVGRWWTRDAELDVLAFNEDEKTVLFGEAKWSTKKVGTDVLLDLKRKAEMVEQGRGLRSYYALFSRKGFTAELQKMAEQGEVFLFAVDDMAG